MDIGWLLGYILVGKAAYEAVQVAAYEAVQVAASAEVLPLSF